MGLFEGLQNLLGGAQNGQGGQQQQRQEYQDFVRRYDEGPPWTGVSDQEATQRYQQVAPQLSPQEYQQSAQEAFSRLSPQERQQFGEFLRQQARQQGVNIPDLNRDGVDDRLQDPGHLAQVTSQVHQQQPGLLGGLLGRGNSGASGSDPMENILANPLAKAALAGIASAQMNMNACNTICKPVMELMTMCQAQTVPLMQSQTTCVCANESFGVSTIGGLCMSCLMMNNMDTPAMMQLAMACPFEQAMYTPQADQLVNGVVVQPTVPKGGAEGPTPIASNMPGMPGMETGTPGMTMPGMGMSASTKTIPFASIGMALAAGLVYILV